MRRISSVRTFKKNSAKGFTFLELLLVLIIIVGVMGLAIPAIYKGVRSPLSLASNQLVSIINELRFKAILFNQSLLLVIDLEKNEYQIKQQNPETGKWVPEEKNKEPILIAKGVKIKEIKKGLDSISREKVRIFFDPGGLLQLFSVTFYLNSEQIAVKTKDVFGKVKVGELQPLQGVVL